MVVFKNAADCIFGSFQVIIWFYSQLFFNGLKALKTQISFLSNQAVTDFTFVCPTLTSEVKPCDSNLTKFNRKGVVYISHKNLYNQGNNGSFNKKRCWVF